MRCLVTINIVGLDWVTSAVVANKRWRELFLKRDRTALYVALGFLNKD